MTIQRGIDPTKSFSHDSMKVMFEDDHDEEPIDLEKLNARNSNNKYHISYDDPEGREYKKIYIECNEQYYELADMYKRMPYSKPEKIYKYLKYAQRYSLSPLIGAFPLARFEMKGKLRDVINYNWEYFAYRCPYWKKRFDMCKVSWGENKRIPTFPNEDIQEAFYELNMVMNPMNSHHP